MCWRPNGDQFGAKSLGVVAWEEGCVVVGGVQIRSGRPLLEPGGVTGAVVGSGGGGGGGGNSGCDGGVSCGGVCCGGGVYGCVW